LKSVQVSYIPNCTYKNVDLKTNDFTKEKESDNAKIEEGPKNFDTHSKIEASSSPKQTKKKTTIHKCARCGDVVTPYAEISLTDWLDTDHGYYHPDCAWQTLKESFDKLVDMSSCDKCILRLYQYADNFEMVSCRVLNIILELMSETGHPVKLNIDCDNETLDRYL